MSDSLVLDEDQYRTWKYQLRDSVLHAMQSSPASREADAKFEGYRLSSSEKHATLRVFKRKAAQIKQHKKSPFVEVLSINTFDSSTVSLDDIAYAFHNATTHDHRNHTAMNFPSRFVDGAILNTTLSTCVEDPFQWFGVKSLVLRFDLSVARRSATYVEYSGTTADREGHKVLFVVRESCPSLISPTSPSFVFKEHLLFTQLADFRIEGVHYYHAQDDPKGTKYPSFLFNKQAVQHGHLLEHVPHICRQKWLLAAHRRPPPLLTSSTTILCESCESTKTTKRHPCRACGHAVCAKCIVWASEAAPHAGGVAKVVVCKRCYVVASHVQPSKQKLESNNIRLFDGGPPTSGRNVHGIEGDDSLRDNVPPELLAMPLNMSSSSIDKNGRESNLTCRSTVQSEDFVMTSPYEPSDGDSDDDEDLTASFVRVSQGLQAQKHLVHQMQRQFGVVST
ncbi:hypothetical protein DYB30_004087 [Aphanomyces astaci]|uniref:FYVE-type domain-containing protein n=1 Tax=Aphanomyces astaci TaxID=112090 RepID=A0A397DDI2_APHAT|nr:hypothetical protein DYB36_006949 [Aphanomyces astaci]RHY63345.1 hypothetical protein DYB30_004087 [Aphanomyces astaci]RHY67271.1 hypothetical protein DYB34_008866 [Aphanomyces astaci]RHZ41382.1 hypothetical protein DYB31_003368 [Aphanomyces astaci]